MKSVSLHLLDTHGFGHGGNFLKAATDTTDPETFVLLRAARVCLPICEVRYLAGLLKINVIKSVNLFENKNGLER